MHGTTVTIDLFGRVDAFQAGASDALCGVRHKTVNMYSLTLATWQRVSERLTQHVTAGRVNEYYETVFSEMVADGTLSLEAVDFASGSWYEIDTLQDLHEAEQIFPGLDSGETHRCRPVGQP